MRYSLKHRVTSWISRNLFDGVTYTVRNGLNKGLRRRGGLGWIPANHDNAEILFWKALDLSGKVVYDIGAFHGLLTIYFARRADCVVAWEPNSRNRQRLLDNIQLNSFSNVIVRPYGLASKPSTARMTFNPVAPGTASFDSRMASGEASGDEAELIEIRTLDDESGLKPPDLVKVDVEGFELEVLKGAGRTLERKPDLFLEMHGADPEDKARRVHAIVDHLWEAGYRNILHVETKLAITPQNAVTASQGHLYARGLC